jgi:hypothetical protein
MEIAVFTIVPTNTNNTPIRPANPIWKTIIIALRTITIGPENKKALNYVN